MAQGETADGAGHHSVKGGITVIPCYVGGKGMHATAMTWDFKVAVIGMLEESGLGYDTRYRHYQNQFPQMSVVKLARMVCDPIENYDRDWPSWQAERSQDLDEQVLVTGFFLERDSHFRQEAQIAIMCLDEAGFGSGVNIMRFIQDDKPILGFYRRLSGSRTVNIGNFLQLQIEYPELVSLFAYQSIDEVLGEVRRKLVAFSAAHA